MFSTISHCPYCEQAIANKLQTVCYECGYFFVIHQTRQEVKNRKKERERIKKAISDEIDLIIDEGGEVNHNKEFQYKETIKKADEYFNAVFIEGLNLLKNRERFLNHKPHKSEQELLEFSFIPEQIKEIEKEAGKFNIRVDISKLATSIKAATDGFRDGLKEGEPQAALGAISKFLGTLIQDDTKQIEEKSDIQKFKEEIENNLAKRLEVINGELEKNRHCLKRYNEIKAELINQGKSPKEAEEFVDELDRDLREKGLL